MAGRQQLILKLREFWARHSPTFDRGLRKLEPVCKVMCRIFPWPRIKTWSKRCAIALAAVVALLTLLRGVLIWHAQSLVNAERHAIRERNEPVEAREIKRLLVTPVPNRENGAPYFELAGKLYENDKVEMRDSYSRMMVGKRNGRNNRSNPIFAKPFDETDAVEIEHGLELNEESLALLEKALAKPGFDFDLDWEKHFGIPMNHLVQVRSFARATAWRGVFYARKGDAAKSAEWLLKTLQMTRVPEKEPMAISQLVRMAVARIHLGALETALEYVSFAPASLVAIRSALQRYESSLDLRRVFCFERAAFISFTNEIFDGRIAAQYPDVSVDLFGWTGKTFVILAKPFLIYDQAYGVSVMGRLLEHGGDTREWKAIEQAWSDRMHGLSRKFLSVNFGAIRHRICMLTEIRAATVALNLLIAANGDVSRLGNDRKSLEATLQEGGGLPDDPCGQKGEKLKMKFGEDFVLIYGMGDDEKDDGGAWLDRSAMDYGFILPLSRAKVSIAQAAK